MVVIDARTETQCIKEAGMIARLWTGRTPVEKSDAYHEFLLRTGIRDYRATRGNLGAWILRREVDGAVEFLVVSLWDSIESVRGFAGDDVERARYYPEDDDYLLEKLPTVSHYETAGPFAVR
jgi:heme-degrading monooxygenase HmoA